MHFDGATVLSTVVLVATTLGLLLIASGTTLRGDRSLRLWGAGDLSAAIGTLLLSRRGLWVDFLTIDVANAFFVLTYALFWSGTRQFARKPIPVSAVLAGPLAFFAASQIADLHESLLARLVVSSLLFAAYSSAACWEIFRIPEQLPSKRPLLALFAVHMCVYFMRVPLAVIQPPASTDVFASPWVVAVTAEALLFLIASSFLLLCMAKERAEGHERILATMDALTGVLNRRSFVETGVKLLAKCKAEGLDAAVLMIDVDHFKRINDEHGHRIGDQVLRAVASAIAAKLRTGDICGRIGGEEFGCFLPKCSGARALIVAERLRHAIGALPSFPVSVSIGVTSTTDPTVENLEDLLSAADQALYQAKRAGRNRVTTARAA